MKRKNNLTSGEWKRLNKNHSRYKLWVFIKAAYEIAYYYDNFASIPSMAKKASKFQNLRIKGCPEGILFTAYEKDLQELKEYVKKAVNDIHNDEYTENVKQLVEYFDKFSVRKRGQRKDSSKKQYRKRALRYKADDIV